MKRYSLYIHINKTNGKVYVGISSNPKKRWGKGGTGYKDNAHFWSAIQKYGWDGFLHIIIRTDLTLNEANELERRWIYLYRADNCEYGYNHTKGGDGTDQGKDYHGEGGRQYRKQYYQNHREEKIEYSKNYNKKHEDEKKAYYKTKNREYYLAHREERLARGRERYRLKKNSSKPLL